MPLSKNVKKQGRRVGKKSNYKKEKFFMSDIVVGMAALWYTIADTN